MSEQELAVARRLTLRYVLMAQAKLMLGRTEEIQALADRAVELGAGDPRRVSIAYTLAAEAALR